MSTGLLAEELSDHYVRALEEQGLEVPHDARGFDRLLDDGSVRWEIRRQLIEMDSSNNNSQGYIIQKLLQDAIIQYGDRKQRKSEIKEIAELAGFYRHHFAAQMELWRKIVGAAHAGRVFTDVELECYNKLVSRARKSLKSARVNVGPEIERMAQAVVDREHLDEHGLLFDRQTVADVEQLIGNVLNARPTLLIGDKGIAKTQVARFVCTLFDHEPVLVSIKGDTRTGDLIGHLEGDDVVYPEGPVPYAMRNGYPILLDEINFGNQAIIARLHDVLLKHPGDKVYFPELGEEIEVAPGFVVFATANEASSRYRQRQRLDPALRDRFEILVRTYPDLDADVADGDHPTLSRMAYAYATDVEGIFSRHIDEELLEDFIDVASISQRLYVMDSRRIARHVEDKSVLEGAVADRPLIEDCISPRTVCRVVSDSAEGNVPGRNLDLFLIDNIVRALDQDGTRHDADIVRTVALQRHVNLFENIPDPEDDEDDLDDMMG